MLSNIVIIAVSPHGVINFGGLCSLSYKFREASEGRTKVDTLYDKLAPEDKQRVRLFGLFHQLPTAVANVLLVVPILKHVMGLFNIISASKTSLAARLNGRNMSAHESCPNVNFDVTNNTNKSFILYPGMSLCKLLP